MRNKLTTFSIITMLLLSILSCNESSNKEEGENERSKSNLKENISILKIYEDLNKKKTNYSLDEIANDILLVTFETTDNSLISNTKVAFVTPQYICLSDRHMLFFFDHSGKYHFTLDARGDGPGEYSSISDVLYDSDQSVISIHDMHEKKILKYDMSGQFINDKDINDIGAITNLDKDLYAASFSPFANKNKLIGIFDKSFEIKKELIYTDFNNERYTKKGFILINPFTSSNNGLCIKPLFSDTLYQIYPNRVEPFFVVDKQHLNPSIEVMSDLSQQKNRGKYISNDYGVIINDLYFTTFQYDNKLYQDIWDIGQGELLYRNIASSTKDKYGVPVKIDDELIHVWPVFVKDALVYCKIAPSDQELLKTNTEDNDLMLKFTAISMN